MTRLVLARANDDEAIEPCPYCEVGGATLAVYGTGNLALSYTEYSFVGCDNCHAEGRRFYGAGQVESAIDNWNQVARAVMMRPAEVES